MPTDPSSAPATTTRRSFLLRSAAGGALATTGVLGLPVAGLVPAAGAQASEGLDDGALVSFTAPLELGAILAYQAGLDSGLLDTTWSANALELQGHHQEIIDTLTTLLPSTAVAPVAADAFSSPIADSISQASDQDGVLEALGQMEDVLSATHLLTLESVEDPITAQVVAQVLAAEAQHATALRRGSGADIEAVTPAAAEVAGAVSPGELPGAPPASETPSESTGGSDGSDASGSGDTSGSADSSSGGAGTSGGSAEAGGSDNTGSGGASGGGDSSNSGPGAGN